MTYKHMKEQFKKIFSSTSLSRDYETKFKIKEETLFTSGNNSEEISSHRYNPEAEESFLTYNNFRGRGNYRVNARGNYRGNYRGRGNASGYNYRGRFQQNNVFSNNDATRNVPFQAVNKNNPTSMNPINSYNGNIMKCHACDSQYHFIYDCPSLNEFKQSRGQKTNELWLYEPEHTETAFIENTDHLLAETINKAILDSGCTATVCGELWLHNLIDSLSDSDKANVVEEKSSKLFKFGDSKMIPSIKKVKVPIWIGDKKNYT